jgi:ATP-dependent Clp protease ATP-binding subunit ClpA
MFERFTDGARHVIVLAQEEARLLHHDYVGSEHLLLGLLHEGRGMSSSLLRSMGLSLEGVRGEVEAIIGRGAGPPGDHLAFTQRAKRILELSLREALDLGQDHVGTEHILLALLREGEGVAAQILRKLGATSDAVRQEVLHRVTGAAVPPSPAFLPLSDRAALALELARQSAADRGPGGRRGHPDPPGRLFRPRAAGAPGGPGGAGVGVTSRSARPGSASGR